MSIFKTVFNSKSRSNNNAMDIEKDKNDTSLSFNNKEKQTWPEQNQKEKTEWNEFSSTKPSTDTLGSLRQRLSDLGANLPKYVSYRAFLVSSR